MINATYFAVDQDEFSLEISQKDIFGQYAHSKKINDNEPIFNYASFFGNGIDMYDNGLILGDGYEYYGYINNTEEILLLPTSDSSQIQNGITIVFDKYSCKKIEVYADNFSNNIPLYSITSGDYLPLVNHIPFAYQVQTGLDLIKIRFSGFPENAYMTLKGVILGKIIEINDFFSFDYISEIKPLGDDLPMNEINSDIFVTENFVAEEGQTLKYYDTSLLENTVLLSAENTHLNRYEFKSRNILHQINEDSYIYNHPFDTIVDNWSTMTISANDALSEFASAYGFSLEYPEWFSDYLLSPFLEPCSGRKFLQQIAWACCCAIDTSHKDKIVFVPFLVDDMTETPDIIITNEDGRIITSSFKKGEKYSNIIWERTEYTKNNEVVNLGTIYPQAPGGIDSNPEEYYARFEASSPCEIIEVGSVDYYIINFISPYVVDICLYNANEQAVKGYKYDSLKFNENISTGLANGKTLTISNQSIFPIDKSQKTAQLAKWYSMNNTISATVVDKGDISVGKTLKIQLENGSFFTGIITKTVRNNVSDYHTIELEAHEWH